MFHTAQVSPQCRRQENRIKYMPLFMPSTLHETLLNITLLATGVIILQNQVVNAPFCPSMLRKMDLN